MEEIQRVVVRVIRGRFLRGRLLRGWLLLHPSPARRSRGRRGTCDTRGRLSASTFGRHDLTPTPRRLGQWSPSGRFSLIFVHAVGHPAAQSQRRHHVERRRRREPVISPIPTRVVTHPRRRRRGDAGERRGDTRGEARGGSKTRVGARGRPGQSIARAQGEPPGGDRRAVAAPRAAYRLERSRAMVGGGRRCREPGGIQGRRRRRDGARGVVPDIRLRQDRYCSVEWETRDADPTTQARPSPAVLTHRQAPNQPAPDRRIHPRQAQGQSRGESQRIQHARGGAQDARDGHVLVSLFLFPYGQLV